MKDKGELVVGIAFGSLLTLGLIVAFEIHVFNKKNNKI